MKKNVFCFSILCFLVSIFLSFSVKADNYDISNATSSWDANDDGSVKGYYFADDHHIEICGEGEIEYSWYLYKYINPATIKSINIRKGVYMTGTNANSLFFQWYDLESVTFEDAGRFTENLTDLNQMFAYCYELREIDLSGFSTFNVTKMTYVFSNCTNLQSVDISSFQTQDVTDMSGMFWGCKSLKNIKFGKKDTSQVSDMSYLFCDCESLESIDISALDTSYVHEMNSMFEGCKSLTNLNLSTMSTRDNVSFLCMFKGCTALKTLDISGFDMTKDYEAGTTSTYMLEDCKALEKLITPSTGNPNVHLPLTMFDSEGIVYKKLPVSTITLYSSLSDSGSNYVSIERIQTRKGEKVAVKDKLLEVYKEANKDVEVKKIKFKSDNKKIAKVNKKGIVTGGKRTGTAVITMYVKYPVIITKSNGKQKKKLSKWTEAAKVTVDNTGDGSGGFGLCAVY